MAFFKGQDSNDWSLQLDRPSILAIREDCDPRFVLDDNDENDNTCIRMEADPVLACRVLYLLCLKQCTARATTEEQFYLGVIGNGDAIQAAQEALGAAIVNFTQPRRRPWIEAVVKKSRAMEALAISKALAKMDDPKFMARAEAKMDVDMDAAIDRALTPLGNAPDSPDSSESTPPG